MTNAETLEAPKTAASRKRNAEATRQAILAAAKTQFARAGYEGAFLRDIAADAGVDAALINRYFGGKEGLFAAVLTNTISSQKLFSGDRKTLGRELAKLFAAKSAPGSDERMQGFRLILRAATSTATASHLNRAVHDRFMDPIAGWMGGENPDVRARLFSALFMGLLVEGLIRDEPLGETERDAFISRLGAIFQSLVDE
jgi:AcrR family transcriptional regulator